MARILPDGWEALEASGAASFEIATLRRLAGELPDDYTVFHGVHWTRLDHGYSVYGEIDFLVLGPHGQVVLIEQKSGPLEETPEGLVKRYPLKTKNVPGQIQRSVDVASVPVQTGAWRAAAPAGLSPLLPRLSGAESGHRRHRAGAHRRCQECRDTCRAHREHRGRRATDAQRCRRHRARVPVRRAATRPRPERARGADAGVGHPRVWRARHLGAPNRVRAVPAAGDRHGRVRQDATCAARAGGCIGRGQARAVRLLQSAAGRSSGPPGAAGNARGDVSHAGRPVVAGAWRVARIRRGQAPSIASPTR